MEAFKQIMLVQLGLFGFGASAYLEKLARGGDFTGCAWVLALHFQQPLQRWRPYTTLTFRVTPGWVEGDDHA